MKMKESIIKAEDLDITMTIGPILPTKLPTQLKPYN